MATDQRPPYTAPVHLESAFNCPRCQAYSNQVWYDLYCSREGAGYSRLPEGYSVAFCTHCTEPCLWHDGRLVFPSTSTAPHANPDLPSDIREDYEEARDIVARSPRGACALLRLAVQKLCRHLREPGENLNADIKSLVSKGLSPKAQKALDIVRVVGNNAVHPGQLDLKDDAQTAQQLFGLVTLVAETMITNPKHVDDLYQAVVPEGQRQAIERRDGATSGQRTNGSGIDQT